ncbi:tetratricopeptide repeat protein [Mucilaginibacter yixingensis]|uniref:Tetratricopeptide repeat protein n=1 Tax=Mucilaginibacter yixingensis TaxID=1295612 RepID=A0A2T5JGR9_9SPHI|nr:tetratricopeptide repeat protein [Mucilaginibacter yixingensis]PTR01627.1 tetratricopeptide repeat protein [Mucilaginibacter yixingensis]
MGLSNCNKLLLATLGILALLIAAYSNHFNNAFHFDDMHTVVNNVYIRQLKNIPHFFTDARMFSADPGHWGMRPMVTTTLAIDYWLGGGLNPFYFQLSTFLWHIALCVVLFFIFRRLLQKAGITKAEWPALIAAGWYALHTANAETLNYVISRSDVLSTFFIVLSLGIFIARPQWRRYGIFVLPAIAGVFSKETVLVLLILLFFYLLLFEKELSVADLFRPKNFKTILKVFINLLPAAVVIIAVQIYTLTRAPSINGVTNPLLPYMLTQSYVWLHYFITFFVPAHLSADTDWSVIANPLDVRILCGLAFVLLLIITIIKTSAQQKTRPIAFGLSWFCAALLPTSLAPFAEVMNDHRMYFPFIGLALAVVSAARLLIIQFENQPVWRFIMPALVLMVFSLNAFGVYQRNKVWHTEESLWYDVTLKSPHNGRGLMNYGLTQMSTGRYAIAARYFEQARTYLPYYSTLYINLGVLNGATGNYVAADENFRKGIAYAPDSYESYCYYARYLAQNNRVGDAREMAMSALQLNPSSIMALRVLMDTDNHTARWGHALQIGRQLLQLLPGDKETTGVMETTRKYIYLSQLQDYNTVNTDKVIDLSLSYYNGGRYEDCIAVCEQMLLRWPDYAPAYNNIGAAYNSLQRWDKAIEALNHSLKIDPKNQLAINNLAWAKEHLKVVK